MLTWFLVDIGRLTFLVPTTFDSAAYDEDTYDIQPVDDFGNVAPVLASSLSSHVPDYILLQRFGPETRQLGDYTDYNHSDNQIQMIGMSCLESVSELQGVPDAPRFRAPELLLEGQLSPKADIWSLDCLVCHQPRCLNDVTDPSRYLVWCAALVFSIPENPHKKSLSTLGSPSCGHCRENGVTIISILAHMSVLVSMIPRSTPDISPIVTLKLPP